MTTGEDMHAARPCGAMDEYHELPGTSLTAAYGCRYDIGVFTNCASDVNEYCAEARSKLRGNATVLKCLVENFKSLAESCQTEMSRAVRLALWDYKPGAALTTACDDDVDTHCPRVSAVYVAL